MILMDSHSQSLTKYKTVPYESYTSTYTRYGMYSRDRRLQRTDRASVRKPGITREFITLDKLVFIREFVTGSVFAPFFDNALKLPQFAIIIIEIVFFMKSYQFQTVIS